MQKVEQNIWGGFFIVLSAAELSFIFQNETGFVILDSISLLRQYNYNSFKLLGQFIQKAMSL